MNDARIGEPEFVAVGTVAVVDTADWLPVSVLVEVAEEAVSPGIDVIEREALEIASDPVEWMPTK